MESKVKVNSFKFCADKRKLKTIQWLLFSPGADKLSRVFTLLSVFGVLYSVFWFLFKCRLGSLVLLDLASNLFLINLHLAAVGVDGDVDHLGLGDTDTLAGCAAVPLGFDDDADGD